MTDTKNVSCCLLKLPNGKFVFQRRTKDAPVEAYKLDLFGGHIEIREGALHALRREIAEETSLDVKHIKVHRIGTFRSQDSPPIELHSYLAHITKPDFKVFEGLREEVYGLDEVLARSDVDPHTRLILEKYREAEAVE
ncbi:MAG TPA: NUDIX hydrolase [Candidatus Saccharimonadales bacterium]|nr:NUDIX hydrolase [Candidatus Saccharimonadales bacterium]